MNILQVCLSYSWGGLEMYVFELAKELRKMGHQVTILVARGSRLEKEAGKENLEYFSFRTRIKYFDLILIRKILVLIRHLRCEVIHLHLSGDIWHVVPAAVLSKRKPGIIFTDHMASVYPKKDILHRLLYRRLELAIATTEVGRKKMLDSCPLLPEKTRTVYYGIDLRKFDPGNYERNRIRKEFGISENTLVVGIIGRIEPKKGQKEFLLAAKEIAGEFPGIKFLIVGATEEGFAAYERKLKKIADQTFLKGIAIFTGFRNDIPEMLAGIDLFVLASYGEAFGLVLVEAMAMKKTVIGTAAGGVPEIIEPGKNGILVPPGDWKSLAEAMRKLILDRDLYSLLRQNARRTVEENFSLDKHLGNIEKIYLGFRQ